MPPKSPRASISRRKGATADETTPGTNEETPKTPRRKRILKPKVPAPRALALLREVQDDLRALKEKKEPSVLRTRLRYDEDGALPPAKNRALFSYEEALLKLLERLDALDTEGVAAVRNARRSAIESVQARLAIIDAFKRGEPFEVEADNEAESKTIPEKSQTWKFPTILFTVVVFGGGFFISSAYGINSSR